MKEYKMVEIGAVWGFILCSLVILYFCSGGCVDAGGTQRVLQQQGYTNVVVTGWRPFAASKDDFYATGFQATSPNGQVVTGTVTRGLFFKGSTVRFD